MRIIERESEILDQAVRKKIIAEIEGPENRRRKYEHYRRHLCYKDQTPMFVEKNLRAQFDEKTVNEMVYAISNISITKKMVQKLARVYSGQVTRDVLINGESSTDAKDSLEQLESHLEATPKMQNANRSMRLHYQCPMYVKPCPVFIKDQELWDIVLEPMAPYLYDVVEDKYNKTKPLIYILSNYSPKEYDYKTTDPSQEGRTQSSQSSLIRQGDRIDQTIADRKEDESIDHKEYIWWSESYHFTTDESGQIISKAEDGQPSIANPIETLPIVNFAMDQDGSFWALGGDDLAMGSILINTMITHINNIGILQGYGQFYMTGKNLPRNLTVGANKAIILEYDKEDPTPNLGFINASPQLSQLMDLVQMYVALMLTTNNLSTSGVSMELGKSGGFPSGVSMMIDKSESVEDVQDQRAIFQKKEPKVWDIIKAWQNVYGDSLVEPLRSARLPDNATVVTNFGHQTMIQTEAEKLANIEKRKSLGLNKMIELIKMDQPELSDEQAEQKLKEILEEKMNRLASAVVKTEPQETEETEEVEDESSRNQSEPINSGNGD